MRQRLNVRGTLGRYKGTGEPGGKKGDLERSSSQRKKLGSTGIDHRNWLQAFNKKTKNTVKNCAIRGGEACQPYTSWMSLLYTSRERHGRSVCF